MALNPRFVQLGRVLSKTQSTVVGRFERLRTYVKEDPTVTYDLHTAYSKDPNTVRVEDAFDEYTKIKQAALRAGKRPPRKKKHKLDAVGNVVGVRHTNREIPFRIRDRLITEGLKMSPQFFIGRYGLNKVVVDRIRSAFRVHEIVRIEVGSPWTDNTDKFAERLELRTGAVVLDRAGGRFFLYRGFTHADLARKGLVDPDCFTVDEYTPPLRPKKRDKIRERGGQRKETRSKEGRTNDQWNDKWYEGDDQMERYKVGSKSTFIDLDEEPEVIVNTNNEAGNNKNKQNKLMSEIKERSKELKR